MDGEMDGWMDGSTSSPSDLFAEVPPEHPLDGPIFVCESPGRKTHAFRGMFNI